MNSATPSTVEIPSGKNASYENFPVGSWLLPARLRPHIGIFYRFARTIDDIADTNTISAKEKVTRLDDFASALLGNGPVDPAFDTAHRMRRSLSETGVTSRHCLDLIEAFKRDATIHRYEGWNDLIDYCVLSAAPVGRYLLDLHDEPQHSYELSDALCNVLQVINHLQDCKDDYLILDRVYIPEPWLTEVGATVSDLDARTSSPAIRQVIDRTLDCIETLMPAARTLPGQITDRRLAMEAAAIVRIADCLIKKIRGGDPLGLRIELTKFQYFDCFCRGAASALWRGRSV